VAEKGIFTMATDGSESGVRLTHLETGQQCPNAWSADGATLAFVQDHPNLDLFTVSTTP
jgi:hypothetical protein